MASVIGGIIAREGIKGFVPYGAGYIAAAGAAAYGVGKGIYNLTKKKQSEMVKRKASKQSGPTAKRNKKYVVLKWKSSKNKRTSVRKHSTKPRTKTNYVPVAGGTLHSGTGACKVVIPIGKGARKGRRVGPWTFRESYSQHLVVGVSDVKARFLIADL